MEDIKVRPMSERIIIRRVESKEMTDGGLYIPQTAQEKSNEAEVVAVGLGKLLKNGTRLDPEVKVGDHIVIGKWQGIELELNGEKLLAINADDVLGVVEG